MQNTFTHRVPGRDHSKNKNHTELKSFISIFYSLKSPLVKPNELIMLFGKFSASKVTTKIKYYHVPHLLLYKVQAQH